jgi:hypothetical protein
MVKRQTKRVSFWLKENLYLKLKKVSKDRNIPMVKIIETCIEKLSVNKKRA